MSKDKSLKTVESLDEILFMAFVGLYIRDENGNFVSLDDKYGVLKDSLKADLYQLMLSLVTTDLPKGVDETCARLIAEKLSEHFNGEREV